MNQNNQPPGIGKNTIPDKLTGDSDWLELAQTAYQASTDYFDSNIRKELDDSIRAFNNQHSSDSKYNSPSFDKRSKIYRPKTRSIIRKNEAAAASAFFSNMEVVDIQAEHQSDPAQQASAEIMKALLAYRLKKTIPWYQVVLGGLQDAQKQGIVIARINWEYEEVKGDVKKDKPSVTLVPLENFRFDPAASWVDPVNTSPYLIELMPMFVCDIKAKMRRVDPKTGAPEWKKVSDSVLIQSAKKSQDSTRNNRNRGNDPTDDDGSIPDYSVAWVQRHIHRRDGEDWEFYTVGTEALLSEPVKLSESNWIKERDYVVGCCVLETHTTNPTSVPSLGKGLQEEANEVANQRLDNVKFSLNKRWFAKRGKNVDLSSLVRNVPGGITMMDDLEDVREINWPDVTASSFQEQDRINADADELLGNFSASSLTTNPGIANNAPARSMSLLQGPATMLVEYLLRTYVETFVEPVLRKLVKLEQAYETDMVILGIAAQKAKILQKYGINQITDELLNQDLTLTVNVGMGATDPNTKLNKFIAIINTYMGVVKNAPPGMNTQEIGKELFSYGGYQDGRRFMTSDNPQVEQLTQQMQQLMQINQQLEQKIKEKQSGHIVKVQTDREKNQTALMKQAMIEEGANKRAVVNHISAMSREGLKGTAQNVISK